LFRCGGACVGAQGRETKPSHKSERSRAGVSLGATLRRSRERLCHCCLRRRYGTPARRCSPRVDRPCACAARPFQPLAEERTCGEAARARNRDARRDGWSADAGSECRRSCVVKRDTCGGATRIRKGAFCGSERRPARPIGGFGSRTLLRADASGTGDSAIWPIASPTASSDPQAAYLALDSTI